MIKVRRNMIEITVGEGGRELRNRKQLVITLL